MQPGRRQVRPEQPGRHQAPPGLLGPALLEPEFREPGWPVRVLRDETLQCPALRGLYPCGEGAGYAGGIVSAAVDGIRCAERIAGGA